MSGCLLKVDCLIKGYRFQRNPSLDCNQSDAKSFESKKRICKDKAWCRDPHCSELGFNKLSNQVRKASVRFLKPMDLIFQDPRKWWSTMMPGSSPESPSYPKGWAPKTTFGIIRTLKGSSVFCNQQFLVNIQLHSILNFYKIFDF